jgi:hypothetical protein
MFSKTITKLLFLIIIVIISKYNVLAGLAGLLVYIYFFRNNVIENFDKNRAIRQQSQSQLRNDQNRQEYSLQSSSNTTNMNVNKKYTKDNNTSQENEENEVKPMSNNYEEGSIRNKVAKQQSDLSDNTKLKNESEFRNKYCNQDGILIKNNSPVLDVNSSFPNLKYRNEACNPCNNSCKFDIISTNEQITTIENLKSIDSNTINVNRKNAIKKNN